MIVYKIQKRFLNRLYNPRTKLGKEFIGGKYDKLIESCTEYRNKNNI